MTITFPVVDYLTIRLVQWTIYLYNYHVFLAKGMFKQSANIPLTEKCIQWIPYYYQLTIT